MKPKALLVTDNKESRRIQEILAQLEAAGYDVDIQGSSNGYTGQKVSFIVIDEMSEEM